MSADQMADPKPRFSDWLMAPIRENRRIYGRVAVAAVAVNLLGLVASMFSMTVYDRVVPNNAMSSLIALSIGVGIALIFDFVLRLLRARFVDVAGVRVDQSVGTNVFGRLLKLRSDRQGFSTGQLAGLVRELETLREFFASATLISLVDVPFVVLALLLIWMLGGPIVLVPLIISLLVIGIALTTQPIMHKLASANLRNALSKNTVLIEAIDGLEAVQACNGEGLMKERWARSLDDHTKSAFAERQIAAVATTAAGIAQTFSYIAVVVVGAAMVSQNTISIGAIVACSILSGRAISPLGQITQLLTRLHATKSAYRQIDNMMESEVEEPAKFSIGKVTGRLELKNVSFQYPGSDGPALHDINLTIDAGQRVALVGKVGSGKTTLARLLAGLNRPTSGEVLLDGMDLRSYDPRELHAHMGVVPQETMLFSGTVAENIAVGRPHIDEAEVLRAAKLSGTHQFMSQMQDGYSRKLADRGKSLSGGQRQSIAVARALAGKPPVVVLDEPSSAMDPRSEAQLLANLHQELKGRTAILVTHRPQMIEFVERVIRVEAGRIISDTARDQFIARHKPKAA